MTELCKCIFFFFQNDKVIKKSHLNDVSGLRIEKKVPANLTKCGDFFLKRKLFLEILSCIMIKTHHNRHIIYINMNLFTIIKIYNTSNDFL